MTDYPKAYEDRERGGTPSPGPDGERKRPAWLIPAVIAGAVVFVVLAALAL